jgi:tetratricopeptide (TPR) repeat protein
MEFPVRTTALHKPPREESMTTKRPLILMGILQCLVLGYVLQTLWSTSPPTAVGNASAATLQGENTISGLEVRRDGEGRWFAQFAYFYRGGPTPAYVQIELKQDPAEANPALTGSLIAGHLTAQRGEQQVRLEINRPAGVAAPMTTSRVIAKMRAANQIVASQELAQRIDWPDLHSWLADRQFVGKTGDQLLTQAVTLIDVGDQNSLSEGKRIIERILAKDPRFEMGYVELARVSMKSNWGPEGLRQAESYLTSALKIKPDSVNAKILLGYVFAHQGRHQAAEALFIDASRTETRNLWLWANWGEVLAMQGKADAAIEKYRVAVTRPRTQDTYDCARLDAFAHLLVLEAGRNDLDSIEALHRQRTEEFGPGKCYGADYARFMLQQRGDVDAAIRLAKQTIAGNCRGATATQVLGLAYYQAWAATTGAQRDDLINQGRIYLPPGPELVYQLATSDRTVATLKQLQAQGESIDQRDNDKWTALAYAIGRKDAAAIRRLLRLGARPEALVGPGQVPAALLPVMEGDIKTTRALRQAGVDYSKIRFQGVTAIEHAQRNGDRQLLEALGQKLQSSWRADAQSVAVARSAASVAASAG